MEFIVGGYYLIQATESKKWMNEKFFPPLIWSASHHICEIYPDSWILPWVSDDNSSKERERNQEILKLGDDAFHAMQLEFNDLFNKDEFGFPNLFLSLAVARDFHRRYLKHLSNIKLLSIALADEYWEEFIQETVQGKNMGNMVFVLNYVQDAALNQKLCSKVSRCWAITMVNSVHIFVIPSKMITQKNLVFLSTKMG